jgi:hypothetical protein
MVNLINIWLKRNTPHIFIGFNSKGKEVDANNPTSMLGSPFYGTDHDGILQFSMFKSYFERRLKTDPVFKLFLDNIAVQAKGKEIVFGCTCRKNCHGDVLVKYINDQVMAAIPANKKALVKYEKTR